MSETSSEINVKYQPSENDKAIDKEIKSSDVDYYFNLLANPNKITIKTKETEIDEILNNFSITSPKEVLHKITESPINNRIESNLNPIQNTMPSIQQSPTMQQSPTRSPIQQSPTRSPIQQSPTRSPIQQSPIQQSPIQQIPTISPIQQTPQMHVPEFTQPKIDENIRINQTPSEIRMRKIEFLRKLSEIKSKGYQLSKEYDFNSSLEEMEYEYDLLKSFADKRNGVKIFKSGMLQAVSVIEFLNDKYDPFDFHLSGWGEHMSLEVDSWEDVLEEIYEKYKGSGKKMAPEIKLIYLLIASASAFHFTKSQSSKLPGLDSVLSSNPGLLSKILNPGKKDSSQFMTAQEINIEKQKNNFKNKQEPNVSIKAPSNVKDILNRIHNLQPSNIKQNNTDTQEETTSNNDRLVSESTLTDSKKKVKKLKKSNISIF
jgi:hypothetical protein